jgi:hypothetical protein
MRSPKIYPYFGVAGAIAVPALAIAAVEIPNVFQAGDAVSASQMNANFQSIAAPVEALQAQVATLQADLAEAQSVAGYLTQPNGSVVPYYLKVLTGTKTSTVTTLAHGIPGSPATQRRFIGCEVVVNYNSSGPRQTLNLNSPTGPSTPNWCDMDDTNLVIGWHDPAERAFQVSLLYLGSPIQ